MPSQSTNGLIQEIRSKLEHIFPGDLCIDVGVSSMYGLITSYTDKKVREARIDENTACQSIIQSKFGTNDQLWDMQERITQLKEAMGGE